jgi:hypothetical protein
MTQFLNANLFEVAETHRRSQAGDPDATAFFGDVFPADSACFLCDQPIGPEGIAGFWPDSASPRDTAILARRP